MILVTGASGTIGSLVVRELVRRGAEVRAMTRQPEKLAGQAAEVVFGDFDEPSSLRAAARDVEALFLLSAPRTPLPQHDLAMIAAARDAGVRRIVKLSAIHTPDHADEALGSWHQPGEAAVRGSGASWTILRPTTFASNSLSWADAVRTAQPVPILTGTGQQGVIDPADVAEVAAAVLTEDGHDRRTYALTGPELISAHDQVASIAAVIGRAVETVDVPLDVAREQMLAAGMPAASADMMIEGTTLVRDGGNAIVTGDVEQVLHRPPRTYLTWVQRNQNAFRQA